MRHEEVLGKMAEFREGTLSPPDRAAVEGHLAACGLCRKLAGRWKDEGTPRGFSSRVMACLEEKTVLQPGVLRPGVVRPWAERPWALRTGWAVAAALLVAAFWHPERSWVKADQAFAFFGPAGSLSSHSNLFPGGAHHE